MKSYQHATWNYIPGNPYPMIPLEKITGDMHDKGLYGIFVGDASEWISLLYESYGRDPDQAQIIEIIPDMRMRVIDDPFVKSDMKENPDLDFPDAKVLIWYRSMIPPDMIRLIG